MNMCTIETVALRLAVNEVLRCKPGAFVLFAPVCKSFSKMSSAQFCFRLYKKKPIQVNVYSCMESFILWKTKWNHTMSSRAKVRVYAWTELFPAIWQRAVSIRGHWQRTSV